jgi:hypothetical protein
MTEQIDLPGGRESQPSSKTAGEEDTRRGRNSADFLSRVILSLIPRSVRSSYVAQAIPTPVARQKLDWWPKSKALRARNICIGFWVCLWVGLVLLTFITFEVTGRVNWRVEGGLCLLLFVAFFPSLYLERVCQKNQG